MPSISNVQVTGVTATGAVVTWTTDVPSDSQVEYGPTSAYGSATALDPTGVTNHSRTLSGLTAGTLYHFRVRSADAVASSDPQTISGVAARWRANDLTGLSANDPVAIWASGIGGLTAQQPLLANRPLYAPAAQNGRAGLVFDGIDDFLNAGNVLGFTGAFTAQFVVKFQDANAYSMVLTKSDGATLAGTQYELRRDAATDHLQFLGVVAGNVHTAAAADTTLTGYHVYTLTVDPAGSGQWYVDGVASGAAHAFTPTGTWSSTAMDVLIGARKTAAGVLEPLTAPMTLLELNLYSVALDAATRHGSELYLGGYYALSVT